MARILAPTRRAGKPCFAGVPTCIRARRHAQASDALDRAAALADELRDPYEQARVALVAADLARSEGRGNVETAALSRAVTLLDGLGEWRERARALMRLAATDGDATHARVLEMEARHLAHRSGDAPTVTRLDAQAAGHETEPRRAVRRRRPGEAAPVPYDLIGACPAIARARELIAAAAAAPGPVLLVGESGTGKDHVARAIHAAARGRDGSFLVIDAASAGEAVLRAGLGAATRQARRAGATPVTLYVDRLDELDTGGQCALLDLLEHADAAEGKTTAGLRIVASASQALHDHVDRGRFRSELFYRLQATLLVLPPLRKRGEDVVLLAEALLAVRLEGEARRALLRHDWPGNVRELQHVVHLAGALAPGADAAALSAAVVDQLRRIAESATPPPPQRSGEAAGTPADPLVLRERLRDLERSEIEEALRTSSGNRSRAARLLRVSRKTLYARMRRLGIEPPPRAT